MTQKFHEGDEVIALVTDDSGIWKDQKYIVEFAYDDVPDLKEPLYSLQHTNGNSGMEGLESQLTLSRTAKILAARKLPTRKQILSALPLSWGHNEGFDLNESAVSKDGNEIEIYGTTDDGLTFGFNLTIGDIWDTNS